MQNKFADVVFPKTVNQAFTYLIPTDLAEIAKIGCRVIAPLGARKLTGFIVALKNHTDLNELKDIQDVLDIHPVFSDELFHLAQWISDYYLCPLGDALKAAIPSILLQSSKKYVESATEQSEETAKETEKAAPRQAQILRYIANSGRIAVDTLKRRIGAKSLFSSLNQLEMKGYVRLEHVLEKTKAKPKLQKYVKLNSNNDDLLSATESLKNKAPRQVKCLKYLSEKGDNILLKNLMIDAGVSSAVIKALKNKNLIEIVEKEILREYYQNISLQHPKKLNLNEEQSLALKQVVTAIRQEKFRTFLLYGVTGSGKTQVYIEAIYEVLAKGKDAIVLVPEISLTPQTVQRFRSHFKDQVAVLHSAMSTGERFDSWRRLKAGTARVAIGPRSAVFAPLKNIGLIVVDEEHEGSYKQSDSAPRYHARDIAVVRAKFADAVVILGSATPSAESYYNAKTAKYQLLKLECRIDDVPLPEVTILDLLKEKRLSGKKEEPVFSRLLTQKIEEKLSRNEQIILLLNRRGFSSFIKCKDCGYIKNCENCNITLTYHLNGHRLRCHYCGFTKKAPSVCPECFSADIIFRGLGTQKVEEELKLKFPDARVVRMDLDTTGRKWAHDKILNDFGSGKYNILLGTQMVAKGLDFHRVTLVGVINADVGLLLPDFRASERTFQLLTQVAGRAGRKELPGEVIIQTYSPESFCLICAKKHDFIKFFNGEILERRELMYPPFGRITCIQFKGAEEEKVMLAAQKYAKIMNSLKGTYQVLGPTPSPLTKIQNKYRWQVLLKSDKNRDPVGKIIKQAVCQAEDDFKKEFQTRGVHIAIDVDPVSLL